MQPPRWTTCSTSQYPWEQQALDYLQQRLPDTDPFRAWANLEFIADDGSINEVDLLVVSLHKLLLVEIKSLPGRVEGDAGTWTWTDERGAHTIDNPILLANRKAKKLKDLLRRQAALARQRTPYVEAVVFLAHQNVQCALPPEARHGVVLRADAPRDDRPDVVRVLTGHAEVGTGAVPDGPRIDASLSRALAKALDQAGIRPTQRHRRVGDFVLGKLLPPETDLYQDWEGTHVSFPDSHRRVRIYPHARQSSETSRAERLRAAQREYRLLDGVNHRGILHVEGFTEHERGPALMFEHPDDVERLDFWLPRHERALDLRARLLLVRQLAEALQYAHSRRLFHRALTPQSVLVVPGEGADAAPVVKLFNWQAGRQTATLDGTSPRLSVDDIVKVGLAGEREGAVYLAPEAYAGATKHAPGALDAFSLGALAYRLITGQPPAASVEELHAKLRRNGGLWLSEVFDGASEELETLVAEATAVTGSARLLPAGFLGQLDEVLARLAAAQASTGSTVHPLDANKDDELEGGFTVLRRLGRGSTAQALLVNGPMEDGTRRDGVLKVALEPRLNERLHAEGKVLRALRHQNVVELYREVQVGGHVALFMATAGTESLSGTYTLAHRLREEGRLSLDLLQRFGEELLGVVDYLEQRGISHRDIKPDNIGIGPTKAKKLTLVLFDFSLSGTPLENLRAGTPLYLDPFLAPPSRPRWDPYAERFAAAVTLYEMATGMLPVWGDGQSSPQLVDDEVTLDVERFDPAVRDELTRFFRKALAREHTARFDNAEEMHRGWTRAFEHIDRPTTLTDPGDSGTDAWPSPLAEDTPVAALNLTPRVLNALERLGVHTVGELHALPRIRLFRNKGIGQPVVREIRELADRVAQRLADRAPTLTRPVADEVESDPRFWAVDRVVRQLVTRQLADEDATVLRALLGLEETPGGARRPLGLWPAQQDVAEALGTPRTEVQGVVQRARERWGKQPWMTVLRDDVARLLERHGAVMTGAELTAALLAVRGCAASDAERERLGGAVAWAAVETEADREVPRFVLYRGQHQVFVVATLVAGEPLAASSGARARWAEQLGARADELAQSDPLLVPERVVEELTAVTPSDGDRPLPPDRLLRLAASASRTAALSSRMELYPRGMPAERALRLGAGSLLGPKRLSVEQVQQRIASRYPEADPLPGRPRLDELLGAAGIPFRWEPAEGEGGAYVPPIPRPSYLESSSTWSRRSHTGAPDGEGPDAEAVRALDERIARAAAERRFLVLSVEPHGLLRAERMLRERFGLRRVNVEALLVDALCGAADSIRARWDVVLRADAAPPDSRDWRNLQQLVARAVPAVQQALAALDGPALLVYPGLLGRYGQLALLEELRTACERGAAPGYVVLVPGTQQQTMPMLDDAALPVVHVSEWARVPSAWLRHTAGADVSVPVAESAGR